MDLGLKGKTAIVTGGGSNIGRAISLTLAKEGSIVVIAELDEAQGQKVADQIKSKGGTAIAIKADVTDWDSVKSMVEKTLDTFQTTNILVNCAVWTYEQLFVETSNRSKWQKEIEVNYWGVINCVRAVLDHMIERKTGSIVNMGSDAAKIGENREAVYAGTKGAVISFTKSIAREVGRYNIRVNAICPGLTAPKNEDEVGEFSQWKKNMPLYLAQPDYFERAKRAYALRRLATAQEIANATVFVASDSASFITGQAISVSGGYTMI